MINKVQISKLRYAKKLAVFLFWFVLFLDLVFVNTLFLVKNQDILSENKNYISDEIKSVFGKWEKTAEFINLLVDVTDAKSEKEEDKKTSSKVSIDFNPFIVSKLNIQYLKITIFDVIRLSNRGLTFWDDIILGRLFPPPQIFLMKPSTFKYI